MVFLGSSTKQKGVWYLKFYATGTGIFMHVRNSGRKDKPFLPNTWFGFCVIFGYYKINQQTTDFQVLFPDQIEINDSKLMFVTESVLNKAVLIKTMTN